MTPDARSLRRELRDAGLTTGAIDAVWPEWWSEAAEGSPSAAAELRYTIARRLGVSPKSLFEGPPRFVWRDRAKYKNLGTSSADEIAILTSFGVAVAQSLVQACPSTNQLLPPSATSIRSSILASQPVVALDGLLALCWATGIPVIQLRLFPLPQKRMHAMSARVGDRFAILLGRETRYSAQAAYTLAHELGHIQLRHTSEAAGLLDIENPLEMTTADAEESSADRFALELLTGDPDIRVEADAEHFTATQLADAAMRQAALAQVDAGILALCLAHATGSWQQAIGALKIIPPGEIDLGTEINAIARRQLVWSSLPLDTRDYLSKVMGSAEVAA